MGIWRSLANDARCDVLPPSSATTPATCGRTGPSAGPATLVTNTAAEAFDNKKGVCQDHTHVFIACCRYIGVPVRYVSGYIHTNSEDHLATHAWAEVWLGRNWHTFDVVNLLNVAESHIKLAAGLDYLDAAPVRGMRSGGGTERLHTKAWVTLAGENQ